MTHPNGKLALVSECLQFNFPQAKPVAVTAAAVSRDEQAGRIGIEGLAQFLIPRPDGGNREFSRIVADTYTDPRFIFGQIKDAVRNGVSLTLGRKIMDLDAWRAAFGA